MQNNKHLFTNTLNEEFQTSNKTKTQNLFVKKVNVGFDKKELKRTNLRLLLGKLKDYSGVENRAKAGK